MSRSNRAALDSGVAKSDRLVIYRGASLGEVNVVAKVTRPKCSLRIPVMHERSLMINVFFVFLTLQLHLTRDNYTHATLCVIKNNVA